MLLQTEWTEGYVKKGGKERRVSCSLRFSLMMLSIQLMNKKFSDLFLRKQTGRKEQPKQPLFFDQNYFHCRLISTAVNTELIRVQTQVKENGLPLDEIKCKWFIKNSHDFREIEDVTSEYYQPCLDDVGSIICVQIEPSIEGKKYNGIIIMKESEVLQIDPKLEQQLSAFLENRSIKFTGRLEAVFSQDEKYEAFELPAEVKVEINGNEISFLQNGIEFEHIKVTSDYPSVQFIRKSFSSVLLNYNERQSYKLSFNNNSGRDLFTLIVRTLSAHSASINPEHDLPTEATLVKNESQCQGQEEAERSERGKSEESLEQEEKPPSVKDAGSCEKIELCSPQKSSEKLEIVEEASPVKEKVEEPKQNNTMLILKLDEQGKELKVLRRQLQQLKVNYNIEKQAKKQVESQLDTSKKAIAKLKQQLEEALAVGKKLAHVSEDNRFYKNEMSILRKELKLTKEKVKELQSKMQTKSAQQLKEQVASLVKAEEEREQLKRKAQQAIRKQEETEAQMERMRQEFERMQNDNSQLRKKLESLHNERTLPQRQPIQQPRNVREGEKIAELQMKLKNLEMLLKYKSGQGESSSSFQLLVNKLTETISEKELQLNEYKKINKSLLQQLRQLKQKPQ